MKAKQQEILDLQKKIAQSEAKLKQQQVSLRLFLNISSLSDHLTNVRICMK